jgi:FAD/FMN-containing dehydrogenase
MKIDVAVPLRAVTRFSHEVVTAVRNVAPSSETVLWGHLGDGNVHVNVLGAGTAAPRVEARVLRLAADLGGTISAEHGVGVSKRGQLGLVRTREEIALMGAVKKAVDPTGRMNPGVVLP